MPTLVLSPRYSEDSNRLWKAAISKEGWKVHRAVRYSVPEEPGEECALYGEIGFADAMAERLSLGLLEPPNDFLRNLPEEMLKREIFKEIKTVGDLPGITRRSFIKPANDKMFPAGIYERGVDVATKFVEKECPIVAAEVVAFDIEVRFYLLDGEILTGDFYRLVGETGEEEAINLARKFVQPHLSKLNLPSSVVLDVGHVEERGWAIVEANCLYASGIYGSADADKILPGVLRAAGRLDFVREEDRRFLRNFSA